MLTPLEVCVDSIESARIAERAGATRLEVCSGLAVGGLTPSYGLLEQTAELSIPKMLLVRPRDGDFVYTSSEIDTQSRDIRIALEQGLVQGVVIGFLTPRGYVDEAACRVVVEQVRRISSSAEIVFHRAIDETPDPVEALKCLISLGFDRVLTSGGAATAMQGADVIRRMVALSDGRIEVMAGGGVSVGNLADLRAATGAHSYHGTFKEVLQTTNVYEGPSVPMAIDVRSSTHSYYRSSEADIREAVSILHL